MKSAANIQRKNENTKRLTFTIVHHIKNLVNISMSMIAPLNLTGYAGT
jgi:hypothetical protein